ncbi:MAG: hypothetical protein K9J13_17585 [Saprospiraceae bacterium]|nr:hypothetical protein [Saprospiraceae bacterium]
MTMIIVALVIVLHSCTKNEAELVNDESSTVVMSREGDYETEDLINEFLDRLDLVREDAEYEGSEEWDYSIDSMLWYIEGALNYKFAFPHEERAGLLKGSLELDMNIQSGDDVNILAILEAYDEALDALETAFESIDEDDKFFVVIDFELVEESAYIDLEANYYFGYNQIALPDGDWKVTGGQYGTGGVCNTSTYLNYDATDKLEQELFNSNSIHQLDVFFTDIAWEGECETYGMSDPNFSYPPAEESVLYQEKQWNASNFMTCLPQNHMGTYEASIIPVISIINTTFNKTVFFEDVYWTFVLVNTLTDPYHHLHSLDVQMGNAHPRLYSPSGMFSTL